MNTQDHYILAQQLAEKFKNFGGKMNRYMFVLGCVMPDINPFTYIKGHMFSDRHKFIKQNAEKFEKQKNNLLLFFHIGVAVHYIGDSFTFTHNSSFKGSLNEHMKYENSLHEFINNNFTRFENKIHVPKSKSASEIFRTLHSEYEKNKSSHENDCRYIYTACMEMISRFVKQPSKISIIKPSKIVSQIG